MMKATGIQKITVDTKLFQAYTLSFQTTILALARQGVALSSWWTILVGATNALLHGVQHFCFWVWDLTVYD